MINFAVSQEYRTHLPLTYVDFIDQTRWIVRVLAEGRFWYKYFNHDHVNDYDL